MVILELCELFRDFLLMLVEFIMMYLLFIVGKNYILLWEEIDKWLMNIVKCILNKFVGFGVE